MRRGQRLSGAVTVSPICGWRCPGACQLGCFVLCGVASTGMRLHLCLQGRVVTAEFDRFFLVNTYVPNRCALPPREHAAGCKESPAVAGRVGSCAGLHQTRLSQGCGPDSFQYNQCPPRLPAAARG